MSTITDETALATAIAEAGLTDVEAELVNRILEDTDASAEEAIASALAMREAEAAPPATTTGEAESAEPTVKQLKDLDKENTRHVETVHRIMGSFVAGFVACEKCDTLGLEPPGPKPRSHDFFQACATCNGYGQVLTGSLEAQFSSINCPDCGGRGYLEMLVDNTPAAELVKQLRAQRATAPQVDLAAPPVLPAAAPAHEVSFGRPAWMGDPTVGQ